MENSHLITHCIIYLLLIMIGNPLNGAGPVVHAYYAELYLKHLKPSFTKKERDAFMRGTLFPDIRYISSISRTKTHAKNVSLAEVLETGNPFEAGVLFHSYVDEQREKIAQKVGIYNHLAKVDPTLKGLILKTIEDEHTYSLIAPQTIRTALLTFDSEEQKYPLFWFTRRKWHYTLRRYFQESPLTFFKRKAESNSWYLTLSPQRLKELYNLMNHYSSDKKVIEYTVQLNKEFEKRLQISS